MKRILLMPLLLLAFTLSACSTFDPNERSVFDGGPSITAAFTNPVSPKNIYQVKLAFNLTVKSANKWAGYCWSKSYEAIMADPVGKYICENRRATRRALSESADNAEAAIKVANTFIRNNPTLSPLAVIDDAWKAVVDYQKLVTPITP